MTFYSDARKTIKSDEPHSFSSVANKLLMEFEWASGKSFSRIEVAFRWAHLEGIADGAGISNVFIGDHNSIFPDDLSIGPDVVAICVGNGEILYSFVRLLFKYSVV